MASIPANAIPNAKPSYYTQNQWNALTKQAKIDEVGYHLPSAPAPTPAPSAPRISTTDVTPSAPRTTGVIVISNRGSPVTDVQSGLQLQAGQGVINVGGGTKGGGISIPISAPTTTSAGVTTATARETLQVLTGGIQLGQSPNVQQVVKDLQAPVSANIPQINFETLKNISAQIPQINVAELKQFTTAVVAELPILRLPDFAKGYSPVQIGKEAFSYVQQHPVRVGLEVATGIGFAIFPQLLPLKVATKLGRYAGPVLKLAGTGFVTATGFQLITSPAEERPRILGQTVVDVLALGGGVYAGRKALDIFVPKRVVTDILISKKVTTRERTIPQLGENVKFTEVKSVGQVAELTQQFKNIGVKQDITAGLGISEQQVVALGRGTKTGKPFALTFERVREITPSVTIGEQVAGTVKSTYTPSFISSLAEPKISIKLTSEQQIPSTLRGQFKGTFAEDFLTGEAKARIRTGKQSTGVIQQFKAFETPSPEPFAEAGLKRYALVSEGLVVRRPTPSLFISTEDILKAQSRRSIFGRTISQEFVGITEGQRGASRFVEFTDIRFPKIGKGRFKVEVRAKPRETLSPVESERLLTQIAEREKLTKLVEQNLEKQLVSPALTKGLGKIRITKETVPLGTIRITSFPKTERGFVVAGIPLVKTAKEEVFGGLGGTGFFVTKPVGVPSIPDVTTPSARVTDITGITTRAGRLPVSGLRPSVQPRTGQFNLVNLLSGTRPGIAQLPRTRQATGLGQLPRLAQGLAQLQSLGQLQKSLQLQKQLQLTAQLTKQVGRLRTPFPKATPPRGPPPRIPVFKFFGLPKTSRLFTGFERPRKERKFKKKKFAPIPFADYLSVTQTAIRTGGYATQPRITKKAGLKYLRAIQRGQLRFPTFEQQRGLKV